MRFKFQCERCDSRLEAESTQGGSRIECPGCGEAICVPHAKLQPGVTLGDFLIERPLGQGGMGTVFLARQQSLDRPVALKVLPQAMSRDRSLIERFTREVRMTARLDHPNIVTAHFAGEDDGFFYMAMSHIDGESLADRIDRDGPIPEAEALAIARKLVDALDYAWSQHQMLHRDIKPANIMLDRNQDVKLLDMGIAKSLADDAGLTSDGQFIGTPYYVSPEQARGESGLDARADIYSLGATLYHMLTGESPFAGKSGLQVLTCIVSETPPSVEEINPAVSSASSDLVQQLMAKNREDRPSDYARLRGQLDDLLTPAETVIARQPPRLPTAVPPDLPRRKPRKWPWIVAGVILLLMMMGDAARLQQSNQQAGKLLRESEREVASAPAEVASRISEALPTFHPRVALRDDLEALLAQARMHADFQEAMALTLEQAKAGKTVEALTSLTAALPAEDLPLWAEQARNEIAADIHREILRQRTHGLVRLLIAGNVDGALSFVDPRISQRRGIHATKLALGLAVAFCKIGQVKPGDFVIDEVKLTTDLQRAQVIGRIRVNGQWRPQQTAECVRDARDWYLVLK